LLAQQELNVVAYSETFFDQQENGSWLSARIVLGELWQIVQPTSVVDIGCGLGQWLKAASEVTFLVLMAIISGGIGFSLLRQLGHWPRFALARSPSEGEK
jgi:hypothetical protein